MAPVKFTVFSSDNRARRAPGVLTGVDVRVCATLNNGLGRWVEVGLGGPVAPFNASVVTEVRVAATDVLLAVLDVSMVEPDTSVEVLDALIAVLNGSAPLLTVLVISRPSRRVVSDGWGGGDVVSGCSKPCYVIDIASEPLSLGTVERGPLQSHRMGRGGLELLLDCIFGNGIWDLVVWLSVLANDLVFLLCRRAYAYARREHVHCQYYW